MKINRSFAQISLTAIITSAVFLININFFKKESHDKLTPDGKATSAPWSGGAEASASSPDSIPMLLSERVLWEDVRPFILEYQNSTNPFMKTKYREGAADRISVLRGFSFNKNDLNEIMWHNNSGINPDTVLFLFGTDGTFNDLSAGRTWPNMRFIALGVKDGVLLNSATAGLLPSIFDKADPCPPECPIVE